MAKSKLLDEVKVARKKLRAFFETPFAPTEVRHFVHDRDCIDVEIMRHSDLSYRWRIVVNGSASSEAPVPVRMGSVGTVRYAGYRVDSDVYLFPEETGTDDLKPFHPYLITQCTEVFPENKVVVPFRKQP